jgi:hypothetical protein
MDVLEVAVEVEVEFNKFSCEKPKTQGKGKI